MFAQSFESTIQTRVKRELLHLLSKSLQYASPELLMSISDSVDITLSDHNPDASGDGRSAVDAIAATVAGAGGATARSQPSATDDTSSGGKSAGTTVVTPSLLSPPQVKPEVIIGIIPGILMTSTSEDVDMQIMALRVVTCLMNKVKALYLVHLTRLGVSCTSDLLLSNSILHMTGIHPVEIFIHVLSMA